MGTENIRGSASETLSLVQFGPVVLIGNDQVVQINKGTVELLRQYPSHGGFAAARNACRDDGILVGISSGAASLPTGI